MDVVVEWIAAREKLPRPGWPVAAAVTGRYPAEPGQSSGPNFWAVLPTHFTDRHIARDGAEYRDCFVDSDGVVRLPSAHPGEELITHWAALPPLPGTTVHRLVGEDARTALRNALG